MSQISQSQKWWVIIAASLALAMVFVDLSALPIALPRMQVDLHATPSQLHWVINAYLLSLGVLIILGGKLGDKFGHRTIFIYGTAVFILSSILCAMAPTPNWMIAARILQGIGGAFMMPASAPLFRSVVSQEEVGKMAGIYVSIASVFLILGPTLGGFFTEYLSWHWIFWINFPIGLVSIGITLRIVPKTRPVSKEKSFDWSGFIWLSTALITLVYGLMEAPTRGWGSTLILSCFLIFLIATYIFIRGLKKHPYPFVDITLFHNRQFAFANYILLIMQCIFMATVFWAIFFQTKLGLSAAQAGMLMLASQAPVFISSHIAGRMFDRYGPRLPTLIGGIMVALCSLWFTIFCWSNNFWWLLPALILFGFGGPFINLTNISSVINAVPPENRGMASGIASAIRQISGSVGLALLGVVITEFSTRYNYTLAFCIMMGLVTLMSIIIVLLAQKLPQKKSFSIEKARIGITQDG